MRVLAKVRQQLQAQQHVLVAVRPHVDLAVVVMVMVAPARGLVRVPHVSRPDRILSCWCPPVRARRRNVDGRVRGQERACPSSGRCHGKVRRTRTGGALASACVSVSDREGGGGRAVERTRSPWGRAHHEVVIGLERDDAILDADAGHYALILYDVRIRGEVDPGRDNDGRCGRVRDDPHSAPRMRHTGRACVRVLLALQRG